MTQHAHLSLKGIPVGTIIAFAGEKNKLPKGWLVCDGSEVDNNTYRNLFLAIGTVWGGSGSTKFNLPDLRGMFLRGVSDLTNNDPDKDVRYSQSTNNPGNEGNNVGSIQDHQVGKLPNSILKFQRGNVEFNNTGNSIGAILRADPIFDSNVETKTSLLPISDGSETRPKNAYVYFIIKCDDN